MAVDMHCHTKISDGTVGIEDLISIAKRRGLTAIAVTDHDTTAGATRAVIIGNRKKLQVIHGVEFSTFSAEHNKKIHILGYLCDSPDRLEVICRKTSESRKKASMAMIRKVLRYYSITPELIVKCAAGSTNIFKQHIMHGLMDGGYADSIYGEIFHKLFSPEEGIALIEPEYPETKDVIDLIHSSGGVAVVAHPKKYGTTDVLEQLVSIGIDGVEAYHPTHSEEDIAMLIDFAENKSILYTGGSDFHGMYSPVPTPLGSMSVPDECVTKLIAYKKKLHG